MNQDEKRKFETATLLGAFKDADNIHALNMLQRIHSHEMLAALLNEVPRKKRQEMLEAVRAYLPFEAHASVDKYEAMNAEKFRTWEERRKQMIKQGGDALDKIVREHGEAFVIRLVCSKCKTFPRREAHYSGATPIAAIMLARQDGWVRDRATNKEVCPKCPCEDRSKRRKCPGCKRRHFAPDCRVLGKIEPGAPLIGGASDNIVRLN